jgi:tetratricopeptide (TPR) repeat protein
MLDTPEHHVLSGMRLLEKGKLFDAEREFVYASELDHTYSQAYRGLGLVMGFKGDFDDAFNNMSKAEDMASSKEEQVLVYVGYMRLYTQQKSKDWLKDVEKRFLKARELLRDLPEIPDLYYHMGIAYKDACKLSDAEEAFKKVLAINKTYVVEADHQLTVVQTMRERGQGQ